MTIDPGSFPVLLTGASGYLGHATTRAFLDAGFPVRALLRDPSRLDADLRTRVEVIEGDLLDQASLTAAAKGMRGLVHLAGLVTEWAPDVRDFERVNVTGTENILAAAEAANVDRVVATSTVMIFGPTDGLGAAHEDTAKPYRAWTLPYQRTKAKALDRCRTARANGLDVRVAFPGALYGPGPLTDGNYLSYVMEKLENGSFPALPAKRDIRWCFSHVDDVAKGHVALLTTKHENLECILGGDNATFAAMLAHIKAGLQLRKLPIGIPGFALVSGSAILAGMQSFLGQRPYITGGGARALLHDWAFSSARAQRTLDYTWQPFNRGFPAFVHWYATRTTKEE